ncbi:MAG: hypothetical protein LUG57_08025 [Oscillospiraceae bacterium]|nr:hypothetical protein [Oscillospiraceae bacterium]
MKQAYREAWEQVSLSPAADRRIMEALAQAQNQTQHQPRPAPVRRRRRGLRLALAALAAALLLSCGAMALGGFNYEEISESLRLLLGIDGGAVPDYIHYDTVTEAENARYADVHHSGTGEVYASAGSSVYSESFLTVELWLSTVTEEQFESYVWRVQIQGAEEEGYIPAQAVRCQSGRWAVIRVTIFRESIQSDSLRLTVYGGTESEEGSRFSIQWVGTASVDVPAADESVYIPLEGLPFENQETGETGQLTGAEIHTGCLILYYYIDGIYDLERQYFQGTQNQGYLAWQNSALEFLSQAGTCLTLADGTELLWLPTGGCMALADDTLMEVMDFADPIDLGEVVSVTIGGETYELAS